MTSVYNADGQALACTVIQTGPCVVTQVRSVEKDGYSAVQLGFGDKKEKHSIKAEISHFAKSNTAPKSFVTEFRDHTAV